MSDSVEAEVVEETPKKKRFFTSGRLLGGVVALLAIAVCVQGYYLYSMRGDMTQANRSSDDGFQLISGMHSHAAPHSSTPLNSGSQSINPFYSWSPFGSMKADPFQRLNQIQQRMDQMFNQAFGSAPSGFGLNVNPFDQTFSPRVDVTEDPDQYVVTIDAPGADKSNLDVKLEDRTLTISGKRDKTMAKKDGGKIIQQERVSGQFQRSIVLPGPVQEGSMTAKFKNGVLRVTVKKADRPKVHEHIQIQ